jgi:hypothetical protein
MEPYGAQERLVDVRIMSAAMNVGLVSHGGCPTSRGLPSPER